MRDSQKTQDSGAADEVVFALGRLLWPYATGEQKPNRFFRNMGKLLTDIDAHQLMQLRELLRPRGVGWGVLLANCLAQALITVGVLASLYAGYLNPEFRVTASQLSAVINGLATILLFALIDPQLSVMTDDVVEGRVSEALFRRTIVWISFSRLAGTILAQVLFVPSAIAIAWVANYV